MDWRSVCHSVWCALHSKSNGSVPRSPEETRTRENHAAHPKACFLHLYLRKGGSIKRLQNMTGHTTLRILEGYLHSAEMGSEESKAELERVSPLKSYKLTDGNQHGAYYARDVDKTARENDEDGVGDLGCLRGHRGARIEDLTKERKW